jgi:hypothetical protein
MAPRRMPSMLMARLSGLSGEPVSAEIDKIMLVVMLD